MSSPEPKPTTNRRLIPDWLLIFLIAAAVILPLFTAKYLRLWESIEGTFVSDSQFLANHWPHPLWQPLWYCGTRFDFIYPPVLRYGTALLTNFVIPVEAYHLFTAIFFCLGIAGVYFLVRMMEGTRGQAWVSALACLFLSPSFLLLKSARLDSPDLMPWRLSVLVRYGEGPHMSALAILPYAIAFSFLALRRNRLAALAVASGLSALLVLTNFYGAIALAIFYPILVWSVWITHRGRGVLLRAVAIPALACALTAFWLTPAYLQITIRNLRFVSVPGNNFHHLPTLALVVLFGIGSWLWASGKERSLFLVFATGSLLFFALFVLGKYYFEFTELGEPWRLIPELDMAVVLFSSEILRRLWERAARPPYVARAAIVLLILASFWPVREFIRHPWRLYVKEPDYRTRVEYRLSAWLAGNLPGARTFIAGATRIWTNTWFENAQIAGASDQGLTNPNTMTAFWENREGTDPNDSVRWLKALGADAIVVSDSRSREAYHDFRHPSKFAGALPVLFDDQQGDVIYGVPRRYASLARVLDRGGINRLQPIDPVGYHEQLRAYSDFVENGPDIPTSTHWNGTESISVHAPVTEGQSILVQVTYDPAWSAWAGKTELPVRSDSMGFIVVDAPPGTQDVTLAFTTPVANRVGYVVSSAGLLLCVFLLFRRRT